MSHFSKHEYLLALLPRYRKAARAEKKLLLDHFCEICGYHRKHAIRLLRAHGRQKSSHARQRRGRKRSYDHPLILQVLKTIWRRANLPCAKRLHAMLPEWVPFYEFELPQAVEQQLFKLSASTIARLLKPLHGKF